MHSREALQHALEQVTRTYGGWSFDIPLPFGLWTRGNLQVPHTRLKRVVQIVSDLVGKPLAECRILDLGCLDGIFSIEFAQLGATVVGVEIREANIQKALFCKNALNLQNLQFRQDDVRNITLESYGKFDAIVCSGILYHLPAHDAIHLIERMHEMVERVVVCDTHVALQPQERIVAGEEEYWGHTFREYADDATPDAIAKALWSSADNPTSFWFTRPSLVNIFSQAGFSSVYECFVPAHLNFGRPGLERRDRCTFVAVKDQACQLQTSPTANGFRERWPEGSLGYAPEMPLHDSPRPWYRRVLTRLKRLLS